MKSNLLGCASVRGAVGRVLAVVGQSTLVLAIAISIFACDTNFDEIKKPKPNPNDTIPTDTLPGDTLPGDSIVSPKVPVITFFGVVGSDTTVLVWSEISFAPVVEFDPAEKVKYKWVLDGDSLANTPTFEFMATKADSYKLEFYVSNSSGVASKSLTIIVKSFLGGFFIVNEGWFGHDNGSVNYFNHISYHLEKNIYSNVNAPLEMGNTTCYGSIWNNSIYLVSKQGRRLVVCDVMTFKEQGFLAELGDGDGRAFAGISNSLGVVTTGKGAYLLNLSPLSIGALLDGSEGAQCGGVYATDKYVFVIHQDKGILIYDTKSFALVKQHANGEVGFARTIDGNLWAAQANSLIKIDPVTLEINEVAMPNGISINNSWGAWNAGPLCASAKENALYFTKSGMWSGGHEIYRYKVGDLSSLSSVFATSSATDDAFYGSGIGVDPVSGDIIATMVKDGFGENYQDNRLVIFNGATGAEKSRTLFQGYWFPAMVVFNK